MPRHNWTAEEKLTIVFWPRTPLCPIGAVSKHPRPGSRSLKKSIMKAFFHRDSVVYGEFLLYPGIARGGAAMLPSKHHQVSFLMSARPDEMVPQDHPLMKVARHVDFSFVREETEDLYAVGRGRPAYPPETLFKVLLLEIWMNLSDVQVSQQLQCNLLYRAFCDIGWNEPIPDDTTLVRFRSRLGQDQFERLFKRSLPACVKPDSSATSGPLLTEQI